MKNKLLFSVAACGLLGMSNANAQIVSSFASLKEAVNSAATNKSYTLPQTENVTSALGSLGGTSLVIDGSNLYEITSTGNIGITTSGNQTLSIENVTKVSGFKRVGDGGVILNNINATTNITNSTFTDNSATYGGVIRNVGTSNATTGEIITFGTINIKDSVFENNYGTVNSSVLSNSGITNITNSIIANNTHGAIGNTGEINIFGSSFNDNSSLLTGGAIRNHTTGILNINQTGTSITIFTNNQATSGGAIYTDKVAKLSIKNAMFSLNEATQNGGAIWAGLTKYSASINGDFSENKAANFGGAIYNSGLLEIQSGTSFTDNTANTGGAIYNSGSITIYDTDFDNNIALSNGGAIYNTTTTGAVNIDASFSDNTAQYGRGGAIYNATSANINTIAGVFTSNYIGLSTASQGGAIYNAGNITTINADFNDNYIEANNSKGGAIYNAGIIDVISGNFTSNGDPALSSTLTFTTHGGAIYNAGTINSISGDFTNNTAASTTIGAQGGAIHNAADATIKSISGSFTNNNASRHTEDMGGAIYNAGVIENLSADFVSNGNLVITKFGGAIYNTGTINITGGKFEGNRVETDGSGGAIYNAGTMTIANANFTDNSVNSISGLGGAIYNSGDLTVVASTANVSFTGNALSSGTSPIDNGIYNISTLNLNAVGAYVLTMNDRVLGDAVNKTGVVNINSNTYGNVILNADIIDNKVNFLHGTLSLGVYGGAGVTLDSLYADSAISSMEERELDTIDGKISNYTITNEMILNQTNLAIDINLDTETADNFTVGSISAKTGVVLINITDFDINDKDGEIVIFQNQTTNENIQLLEEDIIIADFEKNITLTQAATNKGAYEYDLDTTGYTLNGAIALDAAHTQYDMKTGIPGALGNENVNSQSIGYINPLTNEETGKNMVVNGLAGGANGFDVGSAETSGSATLTLNKESTYSSTNIDYNDVNFHMAGKGNNTITFNMRDGYDPIKDEDFTYSTTILNSDFTSVDRNNILTLSGSGNYIINGIIDNLTLNANSDIFATGAISNANIIANGGLVATNTITNSAIEVNSIFMASNKISNSTINAQGLVFRNNYDNGVSYTLNEGSALIYNNLDYLYDGTQAELNSINFNGGELVGMQDNLINQIKLDTLGVSQSSDLSLDVDLKNKTMDSFIANTINATAGFNIQKLILLSDANQDITTISFTDDANLANNTTYNGMSSMAFSPLYQYRVSYDNQSGDFTFNRGQDVEAFNPAIFTSSIAKNVHTLATFDVFDELLMDTDSLNIHKTKTNASSGDYSNYSNAWFKAFGTNENVDFSSFDVDNQSYSGILGIDSDLQHKNGWNGIYSAYVAYIGSQQSYEDVDINQSGVIAGVRSLFKKNNWFTGMTASIGTSFVEGTNLFGKEDFWMFSAGLSNKTGYDLDLYCNKYLLQPSITFSYLYTYTTDYTTSGGVGVGDNSQNALQVKPELKFVANFDNGFRPYAAVSYNWNVLSNPDVRANDATLPELSVDPYAEYKLGASQSINDDIVGYAEVSATTGAREGFGAQLGLKWNF